VEACARLKGGKLPKEKLKAQLQKIAMKRTGGARTDEILGRESGPEGLPHSIIVTPEGPEGEAPVLPGAPAEAAAPEAPEPKAEKTAPARGKKAKGKAVKGKKAKATKAKGKATKAEPTKRKAKVARGKRK
jgi:DNA topoisomerase-6 subunit B